MKSPLLGKSLYLQKPITVVIRNDEWRSYLASLPPGQMLTVKATDCMNPMMLIADWAGQELLVFERDIVENTPFFQ